MATDSPPCGAASGSAGHAVTPAGSAATASSRPRAAHVARQRPDGAVSTEAADGYAFLPAVDEVPKGFPATLLWQFRLSALAVQLVPPGPLSDGRTLSPSALQGPITR